MRREHKPTKRRLHENKPNARHYGRSGLCLLFSLVLATASAPATAIIQLAVADEEQSSVALASRAEDAESIATGDEPSSDDLAGEPQTASSSDGAAETGGSQDETLDEASSNEDASDGANDAPSQQDSAESAADGSPSDALIAMAQNAFKLNELWKSQEGGTSKPLAIKSGGTYALTADLRVTDCITIDAPNEDVVIDLGSYVLSSKQPTSGYLIRANDCASLTIRGTRPLAGISPDGHPPAKDQIVIDEGDLRHAIEFSGKNLVIENVGIALEGHKDHAEAKNLDACGVYVTKGDARITNCGILVDHSIQANVYSNGSSFMGFPKALYLGKEAGACSLEHSMLTMKGSPVVDRPKSVGYKATTFDNAYGIYSETDKALTVQGGSICADSALGCATGIYAKNVNIEKSTLSDSSFSAYDANPTLREQAQRIATLAVNAEGGDQAYGISVSDKGQATLDAPVLFRVDEFDSARHRAALRAASENAFAFAKSFSAQHATVIAGAALDDANSNGLQFGSFSTGVDQENRQRIASSLENGLEDGVCTIRVDGNKLLFAFEEERAPAAIVGGDGSERSCESVDQAFKQLGTGDTVKLLKDCASITIDAKHLPELEGLDDVALDLNGHAIAGLVVNTDKSLRVFSSSDQRGSIRTASGQDESCVVHKGTGSLALEGIDVIGISQYRGTGTTAYGIEESSHGTLELSDVGVRVVSDTTTAYGIYQGTRDSVIQISNSTVNVSSETPGVNVAGIEQSAAASLTLVNTTIDARSYDGTTSAVEARGVMEVQGGVLSASTRKASTSVSTVRLSSDTARSSLTSVSCKALCIEDPVDLGYFCLMAGNAQPTYAAAWTLGGACAFESSTGSHINHKSTPVTLSPDFTSVDKIALLSVGLDDDIAVEFTEIPEQTKLSQVGAIIEPHAGSIYQGWGLGAGDDGTMHWERGLVVRNVTSSSSYASLAEAFAGASEGDTIDLLGDVREICRLEMPTGVVLDLAGHTLELEVPASEMGEAAGILEMKGAGNHSMKNGELSISSKIDRSFLNSRKSLVAIGLEEGADLDLEDASIRVDVSGDAISTSGTTQVVGISAPCSSVRLLGSSSIEMNLDATQPLRTQAIDVGDENGAASLLLGSDASVTVNDGSQRQARGAIWHPGIEVNKQTLNLIRFYPDESSAECKAFQERFKEEAKADVVSDAAGHAYNTSLYYAAPIAWDEDTNVFAFSSPVPSEKVGYLNSIRADVLYSQTYYDDVPCAQAITVKGSSSAVRIDGHVSATSEQGNASALTLDADDGDNRQAIEISSAGLLTAQASAEAYREQMGEIDFRTALGVKGDRNPVYPADKGGETGSTITYREVRQVMPVAQDIAGSNAACAQIIDATPSSENEMLEPQSEEAGERAAAVEDLTAPMRLTPETVKVTFDNLRNPDASSKDAISRTQAFGSTIGEGGELPVPSDYASNGITYRFVGWRIVQSAQGSGARSSDSVAGMRLDRSTGAAQGALVLNAVYVPVLEGQHLIAFSNGSSIMAYAVDDGKRPEYRNAVAGAAVSVPTRGNSSSGVLSSFTGWRPVGADVAPILKGILPKAHEDRSYEAVFSETPRKGHANFFTWQLVNGKLTYTYSREQMYYGETGAEQASALADPETSLYSDDIVYEFLGWAPRQSDKESFYGLTPPVLTSISSVKSIYGVYRMSPREIRVNFYVDGKLYAQSPAMLGTVSLNAAFSAAGKNKPADKSKELRFRGWSLKQDDTNYIRGAVRSLASLTEGEKDINVYAVYGEAIPEEQPANGSGQLNLGQSNSTGSGSEASGQAGSAPIFGTSFTPAGGLGAGDLAAAIKSAVSFDELSAPGNGAASTLEDEETPEASAPMALGTLVLFNLFVGGFIAWWIICARRNRRLDREADFFEPESDGSLAEQVVF